MGNTPNVIRYSRVSTEEQADSGAGLGAQAETMQKALDARGWSTVADLTDEAVSGAVAPCKRPQLAAALEMLADGQADALIVAKLDRATRSVADLCELLDLADKQGWDFVALDLGIDTSTPMGRAMAQMSGVFAELERKLIGQRTSGALQARKAEGVRLGRPVTLPESVRQRIAAERREGETYRAIAGRLTDDGVPTARGGFWHAATVREVCQSVALDSEMETLAAA